MPNMPAAPRQSEASGTATLAGFFLGAVTGHALGYLIGIVLGAIIGFGVYGVLLKPRHEKPAAIKLYAQQTLIICLFAIPILKFLYADMTWGGDGAQLIICGLSLGMAAASVQIIREYFNPPEPVSAGPYGAPASPAAPPSPVPHEPSPSPATPPPPSPADSFAFNAERFRAAREAPPRQSLFLPLISKHEVDLGSDAHAQAFAGALETSSRAFMISKLDKEIADPATAPDLRQFLRKVRAILAGELPPPSAPLLGYERKDG